MDYEIIIGLEVHLQSKTQSKMFCGCSTDYFGKDPNTFTCPVCLGLPGAMPVPNRHAIDLCIKMALGLNCKVPLETKFDRKNYFYPDLPKGYQISQYDQPIGINGFVEIDVDGKKRKIGITRVHQEEDTGKSIHKGDSTLLDFNKSGVPLIEVVSEPDLRSVEEVTAYAKLLHQTARYLGISDGDMEKGQMRFEINISLRKKENKDLPDYKVEVKNIGSISVLQKVIEIEVERQLKILESGKIPVQETRGLSDMHGSTFSQRIKETSDDYRYFPEPDIPPIEFTEEYIEEIRSQIEEKPQDKITRYVREYGLDEYTAKVIVSDLSKMKTFEEAIAEEKDKKVIVEVSKLIIGSYSSLSKDKRDVKSNYLNELASLIVKRKLSRTLLSDVLLKVVELNKSPSEIIKIEGLEGSTDSEEVERICNDVIKSNSKIVEDIRKNPNAIMALVGQVMKQSKGKADAIQVKKTLEKLLNK